MVSFYKPPKKDKNIHTAFELTIDSLDLLGRGVGKRDGKVYFAPGLLPGENARVLYKATKGSAIEVSVTKILKKSPLRQESDCAISERCGGCPLMFIPSKMSFDAKQQGLCRLFNKSFNLSFNEPDFTIESDEIHYRRACRLALRVDHGILHLGFRANKSHDLVPVSECNVLTRRLNNLLNPLSECLSSLDLRHKIGHVELLDSARSVGVLLRMTAALNKADETKIKDFAKEHSLVISAVEPYKPIVSLQKDEECVKERLIAGNLDDLYIVSSGIKINCLPSSFVQVNESVNLKLVEKIISLVAPKANMRILDLFCGLGNFTLPLAKSGAQVYGVDIVREMVLKARENALKAGLTNANFSTANLSEPFENQTFAQGAFDAAVLDPGRSGASYATAFLAKKKVPKIVMISCNPQAAARDAQELLKAKYKIVNFGALDMFPRTSHVETVLVFEKIN